MLSQFCPPGAMDARVLTLLCVLGAVGCKTIYFEQVPPTIEEVVFLRRYGYLPDTGAGADASYTAQSVAEPVRRLQAFAGLPPTGALDRQTKQLFTKKRCGMKDIEDTSARKRRYVIQQGWSKKTITYRVLNGSSTLSKERAESLLAAALAVWEPHVALRFERRGAGDADIELSFARGDHGDGFPFDGPGRVVAHAFCPPHGAMHFDDDEVWGELADDDDDDDDDDEATDFFAVAVHELGHALGLAHSDVRASVMFPYYQVPVERLHADDILGLQELYTKEQTEAETDSPVLGRSSLGPDAPDDDPPDLCFTNYDTIQVLQGKIHVFEEEWMWVLSRRKMVEEGYPKRFHDVFVGLPADITAVRAIYEKMNGNIIVFSGKYYWEFGPNHRFIKRGRLSEYGLPPSLAELSTAFLSNYNNKTYLIDDERFWRFDEAAGTMDPGYPKEMSVWRDLPYPIDSAIIWEGDTYFFRGPRYWRFDNSEVRAHPYYPLPVAQIWFDCAPAPDMALYVHNDD